MSQPFTSLDGLTLRVLPYGDSSVHLLVLTREQGKVMLRVRGARRRGSPLLAYAEPLVYARYTVFDYRGRLTVEDAEAHSFFMPLRSSVGKLALATYFADIAERLAEGDADDGLLTLTLTALHYLAEDKYVPSHIKAVYEWRTALLAGYRPALDTCAVCEKTNPSVLRIDSGTACCTACDTKLPRERTIKLQAGDCQAIRHIVSAPLGRCFAFETDSPAWQTAAELYLQTHLAHGFDSLVYYREVIGR